MSPPTRSATLSIIASAAFAITCSGTPDGRDQGHGKMSGTVWLGGPVKHARVHMTQLLVDGTPNAEFDAETDDAGRWEITVGIFSYAFEITATGGSTSELATGEQIALASDYKLHGVVLDYAINEVSADISVSPISELSYQLAHARFAAGKDPDLITAYRTANRAVGKHFLDTNVTRATYQLDTPAPTATPELRAAMAVGSISLLAHRIAENSGFTSQNLGTREVLAAWVQDITNSIPIDGKGANEAPVTVGACTTRPELCQINQRHLRALIAENTAAFLQSDKNGTTRTWNDMADLIRAENANQDDVLFATAPIVDFDGPPVITWKTPTESATVSGNFAIDVSAASLTEVVSMTITATGAALPADEDAAPGRILLSAVPSATLPEGEVTLHVEATDANGHVAKSDRIVVADNAPPGVLTGTVALGRVGGAPVHAYKMTATGDKGAPFGAATTLPDGTYSLTLGSGYNGDLLVEVGGNSTATYPEEARPGAQDVIVTLDVNDVLTTVVPGFVDGSGATAIVSPLTTWSRSLSLYLRNRPEYAGQPYAKAWADAVGAIQSATGVPNITGLAPGQITNLTTLTAPAKYALVLAGISQRSLAVSSSGGTGGDAGAFGAVMASTTYAKVIAADISDGCLDGLSGTTPLLYGGNQHVTAQAVRRELADGIVAYLGSSANVTPFAGADDVLSLLDAISSGGPATALGSCNGGGLYEEPGHTFDQAPPRIDWLGETPQPATAIVHGTIKLQAKATDLISASVLNWTEPMNFHDDDNDDTNAQAQGAIDTTARADGPLKINAHAVDRSGNFIDDPRDYTVDNTPPTIVVDGPPNGVEPGKAYTLPRVLTWSMSDLHPGTMSAMLTGASSIPINNGYVVAAQDGVETAYRLFVTGADGAGNAATPADVSFSVDRKKPEITYAGIADGAYYPADRMITFDHTDLNHDVTTATLNGAAFTSGSFTSTPATADKPYALHIVATDKAGNSATKDLAFVIDRAAPTVTIVGVTDNAWYNATVAPTVTITDTNLQSSSVKLDNSDFLSGTPVVAEGTHVLTAVGTDKAGTTSTKTVTFFIDKTKPTIAWGATTPADGASLKASFHVEATAADNLALNAFALTSPAGQTDADNTLARIDYTLSPAALGDQTLAVTVTAVDKAGNSQTATRTFVLDTTPPTLTVDTAPFLALGSPVPTYWSDHSSGLNLTGTAMDAHLQSVTVTNTTTGTQCGTSSTSSWSISLACLAEGENAITVVAVDTAGSATGKSLAIGLDTTAPAITLATSSVFDEANDSVVTMSGATPVAPQHTHTGGKPSLDRSTDCSNPTPISLYGYLHDEDPQPYGTNPDRNPFTWAFKAKDVGAGVDWSVSPAQYRISLYGGATLVDWTTLTGVDDGSGGRDFATTLYRRLHNGTIAAPAIPKLDSVDGVFQIDFRATDRFNRTTTETRCWRHHPLAAPLSVEATPRPAQQVTALSALALGDATKSVASLLLNDSSPGAGLVEFKVTNMTAETVYTTFTLNPPTDANGAPINPTYTKASKRSWLEESKSTTPVACEFQTGACLPRSSLVTSTNNVSAATPFMPTYSMRVLDTSGTPFEMSPCSGCTNTNLVRQYAIGPRFTSGPRVVTVVSVIKTVPQLRPTSTTTYSEPTLSYYVPPSGVSVLGITFTGTYFGTMQACDVLVTITHGGGDPNTYRCDRVGTYREYAALSSASIAFSAASGLFQSVIETAPTATIAPTQAKPTFSNVGVTAGFSSTQTLPANP